MDVTSQFVVPGIVFSLTLASGLWLSLSGKPLNAAIFNVHKLIALGAVILTAVRVSRALRVAGIQVPLLALIILAALSVVALFATGALMSMEKPAYAVLLTIHRVAPILALIAMAAAVYLLHQGVSLAGS